MQIMNSATARRVLILGCGLMLLGTLGCSARQDSPTRTSSGAGIDARGEVTDSSLVEEGSGRIVEGIDGWEGEVVGNSFPGAKFDRLQIGMTVEEVTQLLGEPNDKSVKLTTPVHDTVLSAEKLVTGGAVFCITTIP